jgi:hypothetical protein
MEILDNLYWHIAQQPFSAIDIRTTERLTRDQLDTIVFNKKVNTEGYTEGHSEDKSEGHSENKSEDNAKIHLSFPLNDNFLFFVTREVDVSITVEQILQMIHDFYQEPLIVENVEDALEGPEEWKADLLEKYNHDDRGEILNIDVFNGVANQYLYGIQLEEETGDYLVMIGQDEDE